MDLNAPLGLDPPRKPRRKRVLIGCASAGAVGLCALGAYLASANPSAKEPSVVAAISPQILAPQPHSASPPRQPSVDASQTEPGTTGSMQADTIQTDSMATGSVPSGPTARPMQKTGSLGDAATMEHGVKVVRAAPTATIDRAPADVHGPLIIDVTRALGESRHAARAIPNHLPEPNPNASIPTGDQGPRVAIFVEGMGLGSTATHAALETMPAAVDFAFVPYGATIAASVATAKAKGHEVLLQLPMDNGQGASLGPHMLRPGEPAAAFADDMTWLTSQFSGYAGVANLLGEPVTADGATMSAVLRAVAARSLFYVDDGTSRRSLASSLAPGLGATVLKADVVIDATSDQDKVRANLESLLAIAKRKGSAIGMASGLPDHIATIAKFAAGLGREGVKLVPLSALAGSHIATAIAR